MAAINPANVIYRNDRALDGFQTVREFAGPVWNHFKTRLFPLQPAPRFNIGSLVNKEGLLP